MNPDCGADPEVGGIHHLEVLPLSLRDISKEMMRATRQEA